MTHSDYIAFFEDLATRHKLLLHSGSEKHFVRANIEELITGLRSKVAWPCLVLESYELNLVDNKSDDIYLVPTGAFTILTKVQRDNYDQENEAINTCMGIGLDIISAMRKDYRNMGTTAVSAARTIKYFDPGTVKAYKVGPVMESCFGYRFEFQLGNPQSLAYDNTKWN